MIEIVSTERCIECNLCVRVCPTDVFDRVPGGVPQIARQDDCQTCFMCEAYCPTDAIFVAPETSPAPAGSWMRSEEAVAGRGLMGAYRHALGWASGQVPASAHATPQLAARHLSVTLAAAASKVQQIQASDAGADDPPAPGTHYA